MPAWPIYPSTWCLPTSSSRVPTWRIPPSRLPTSRLSPGWISSWCLSSCSLSWIVRPASFRFNRHGGMGAVLVGGAAAAYGAHKMSHGAHQMPHVAHGAAHYGNGFGGHGNFNHGFRKLSFLKIFLWRVSKSYASVYRDETDLWCTFVSLIPFPYLSGYLFDFVSIY